VATVAYAGGSIIIVLGVAREMSEDEIHNHPLF